MKKRNTIQEELELMRHMGTLPVTIADPFREVLECELEQKNSDAQNSKNDESL